MKNNHTGYKCVKFQAANKCARPAQGSMYVVLIMSINWNWICAYCIFCRNRWHRRRTVQQIRRQVVDPSCKSSNGPKLRLQMCRCFNSSLLETLAVHR